MEPFDLFENVYVIAMFYVVNSNTIIFDRIATRFACISIKTLSALIVCFDRMVG